MFLLYMELDLQCLVAKYGMRDLYNGLQVIMKKEYDFLCSHFQKPVEVQAPVQAAPIVQPVKVKKVRKERVKKSVPEPDVVNEESVLEVNEIKEVVVTDKVYRDPKEMKEYQKKSEDDKRKENEAAGIQLHQILTKENLKQWVEAEGRTYAWVAREKAGCPETQVAATAQMMGIKSKISKRRGILMGGK
jgi:hypothetical protein